jgi:hypothetical protein
MGQFEAYAIFDTSKGRSEIDITTGETYTVVLGSAMDELNSHIIKFVGIDGNFGIYNMNDYTDDDTIDTALEVCHQLAQMEENKARVIIEYMVNQGSWSVYEDAKNTFHGVYTCYEDIAEEWLAAEEPDLHNYVYEALDLEQLGQSIVSREEYIDVDTSDGLIGLFKKSCE